MNSDAEFFVPMLHAITLAATWGCPYTPNQPISGQILPKKSPVCNVRLSLFFYV